MATVTAVITPGDSRKVWNVAFSTAQFLKHISSKDMVQLRDLGKADKAMVVVAQDGKTSTRTIRVDPLLRAAFLAKVPDDLDPKDEDHEYSPNLEVIRRVSIDETRLLTLIAASGLRRSYTHKHATVKVTADGFDLDGMAFSTLETEALLKVTTKWMRDEASEITPTRV